MEIQVMEVKEKKIGILTYHRAHNFGALLQAYALKVYISSLGYQVEFVDYWPDYHREVYTVWNWHRFWHAGIKGKGGMIARMLFAYSRQKTRCESFLKFINEYILSTTVKKDKEMYYNVVMYGSDQIWRYQPLPSYKGYDKIYFGDPEIVTKRRVAYAASMGEIHLDAETTLFLKKNLANFDAISVRESDLQEHIQPLTPLKVYYVIDPVFLLSRMQWDSLVAPPQEKRDYILLYNLQNNRVSKRVAKKLSKDRNLPIIVLNGSVKLFEKKKYRNTIGPQEFLSYVKYATCVVTSSFHGTAFSIIYQKEFYACLVSSTGRVYSLLAMVGLEDRFISNVESYSLCKEIDYCTVEKKLQSHRESSIDYIKSGMTWN